MFGNNGMKEFQAYEGSLGKSRKFLKEVYKSKGQEEAVLLGRKKEVSWLSLPL